MLNTSTASPPICANTSPQTFSAQTICTRAPVCARRVRRCADAHSAARMHSIASRTARSARLLFIFVGMSYCPYRRSDHVCDRYHEPLLAFLLQKLDCILTKSRKVERSVSLMVANMDRIQSARVEQDFEGIRTSGRKIGRAHV